MPAELRSCADCISQEHAGNDPNTQLVPSGTGSSSWTAKPEETNVNDGQPSITANATWASQPRPAAPAAPAGAWQPPTAPTAPTSHRGSSYPVDRHLNPEEFPSLAATAKASAAGGPKSTGEKAHEQVWTKMYLVPDHSAARGTFCGCMYTDRRI